MKKRACLALFACLLAGAGCQLTARDLGDPPDPPSAPTVPELPHPDAAAPHRHTVKYHISRIEKTDENDDLLHINNRGQVLFQHHLWTGRQRIALTTPSPQSYYNAGEAADINNAGVVIGNTSGAISGAITSFYSQAVIWHNGKGLLYSFVKPPENTVANAINNHGVIAGYSYDEYSGMAQDHQRAFYCKDHVLTDIGPGFGEYINDEGQVLVTFQSNGSGERPLKNSFVWDKGKQTPIIPPSDYDPTAEVSGINNAGQVIGAFIRSSPYDPHYPYGIYWQNYGFLWKSGVFTMLGTFGGINNTPKAINNKGQIVGRADTARKDDKSGTASHRVVHAFLWQRGHLYDLNDLIPRCSGWVLGDAVSINDKGQIVGTGNKGAFLLTPIR